jgi:hypothetical protein
MKLDNYDLQFAANRLPVSVKKIMQTPEWKNNLFVGGGYLRSVVSGEPINDVDIFVKSKKDAELLAYSLCRQKEDIVKTDNAYTIKGKLPIQIIHRWIFEKPEDVSNSFDFTICCAVIYFDDKFDSYCDDRFYIDIASKRLVYRSPIRNEDAGGSMLRVLKYYQKGYRIPLDSLGGVISRLVFGLDTSKVSISDNSEFNQHHVTKVITGLLREVDPNVDPNHISHLPSMKEEENQ